MNQFFSFSNQADIHKQRQRLGIKESDRTTHDYQRIGFCPVCSPDRNMTSFENIRDVKIVHLEIDRKAKNFKITQWPLIFQCQKWGMFFFIDFLQFLIWQKCPFALKIITTVYLPVNNLHSQIAHTRLIGIRVTDSHRMTAAKWMHDIPRFPRQSFI